MNQPKFKFGDKVAHTDGEVFVVTNILFSLCKRFFYLPKATSTPEKADYDGGYWEEELELFQEPQKKKLYAYRQINTITELLKIEYAEIENSNSRYYERAPEYDIEFGEAK